MKCYLCDNLATSNEHIPPKSFFPEGHRINLIRVPSCSLHNEATHLDDEYVRNLIALSSGNNGVAVDHSVNKVFKSFKNSPRLASAITKNPTKINKIRGDDTSKNIAFQVDTKRFDRVIKKIAYGLYYYEFGSTWNRLLTISRLNFITNDGDLDTIAAYVKQNPHLYNTIAFKGNNPQVFKYAIVDVPIAIERIIVLKFYDNFEVWAVPNLNSDFASMDE
jgi:hypothetical protein